MSLKKIVLILLCIPLILAAWYFGKLEHHEEGEISSRLSRFFDSLKDEK